MLISREINSLKCSIFYNAGNTQFHIDEKVTKKIWSSFCTEKHFWISFLLFSFPENSNSKRKISGTFRSQIFCSRTFLFRTFQRRPLRASSAIATFVTFRRRNWKLFIMWCWAGNKMSFSCRPTIKYWSHSNNSWFRSDHTGQLFWRKSSIISLSTFNTSQSSQTNIFI